MRWRRQQHFHISGTSTGTPASGGGGGKTLVMLDTAVAPSLDNDGASAADPALQQGIENTREPLIRYPAKDNGKGVLDPGLQGHAAGVVPSSPSRGRWARTA